MYIEPKINYKRTKEYLIGWTIAYYQWYLSRKFSDIFDVISYQELEKMYYTLHEADVLKFVLTTLINYEK